MIPKTPAKKQPDEQDLAPADAGKDIGKDIGSEVSGRHSTRFKKPKRDEGLSSK